MKRILLAWGVVWALAGGSFAADTAGRAARLEKLKAEFPAHVAGADLEKMHPVARECFEAMKRDVDRMSLDLLAEQAVRLAGNVDLALRINESRAKDQDNVFGSAGRTAAKRNAFWLQERVKPWLRRVANVAQGK